MKTKLNPKQERFVSDYLIDLNATQAAIRAGYSARSAARIGAELLQKTQVAAAIQLARKERVERTEITADRVLKELARIGFMDPRRIFNDDGSMKPLSEIGDNEAAVIAGVEVSEIRDGDGMVIGHLKKIKLSDKISALNTLAKHLGLLNDKLIVSGDPENPIKVMLDRIQGNAVTPVTLSMVANKLAA